MPFFFGAGSCWDGLDGCLEGLELMVVELNVKYGRDIFKQVSHG
jgi:hypothetical protein